MINTGKIMGRCAIAIATALLTACDAERPADSDAYAIVDQSFTALLANVDAGAVITSIDHSRLAAEAGTRMPPARVLLFSDPVVNTGILKLNPVTGLDLPYRVLSYQDGGEPAIAYTTADFLRQRHALADDPALSAMDRALQQAVRGVQIQRLYPVTGSGVTTGLGINVLNSKRSFDATLAGLREVILAEEDTVWFGEIDYRSEAAALGETLPPLTLLLFGAPGPGGKAMADFPRMGLDAFCQKVLVHELPDGQVRVYFNEMPAFARLHHGEWSLPHKVINYRMGQTLRSGID